MKVVSRVLLLLSLFAVPSLMLAQGLGGIVGTITDPSGAVVPGAQVRATESGTGVTRSAVTDAQGYYVLSSLRPEYRHAAGEPDPDGQSEA
jgi:protocatechuate 3,4-dioxygenase beta subunit